ncbi:hypothetical protein [Streptomyces sp. COG21]|uniref:hypothetical protein n=1 Tax=Streptomyces sp. COG21 TaxID=2838872 RepID=UPI0035A8417C
MAIRQTYVMPGMAGSVQSGRMIWSGDFWYRSTSSVRPPRTAKPRSRMPTLAGEPGASVSGADRRAATSGGSRSTP